MVWEASASRTEKRLHFLLKLTVCFEVKIYRCATRDLFIYYDCWGLNSCVLSKAKVMPVVRCHASLRLALPVVSRKGSLLIYVENQEDFACSWRLFFLQNAALHFRTTTHESLSELSSACKRSNK